MTKYYHITTNYLGEKTTFNPNLPYYIQKGEDRRTKRVCVTENWKYSIRAIIVLKRRRRFYCYSSNFEPINPIIQRENLLKEKKIKTISNDFKLPRDGIVNKELWYLEPIEMAFEGMIVIPDEDYARMVMAMGFPSGDPNISNLKLEDYKEEKSIFDSILQESREFEGIAI